MSFVSTSATTPTCEWSVGPAGLEQLAEPWDELALATDPRSVFLRNSWARAWAAAHEDLEIRVLALRDRARVVAILPWVAWPGSLLGLPIRRWVALCGIPTETTPASRTARWLCRDVRWGWGATTPLLFAKLDRPLLVMLGLKESLRSLPADLLQIQGLGPEIPIVGSSLSHTVTSTAPNWVAVSGGEQSGRKRLSKRSKKRLATGLAALQALPGFRFDVTLGSALGDADLDELEQLERKSTKATAGASILTSGARNRGFLAALLRHEPSCRVGRLRTADRLIAWALGMRASDRGEGFLLAHDPAYDEHYPGLLAYVMVEEALDQESPLASYSLGRGEEFWKTGRLLGTAEPRIDLNVYAPNFRGRVLAGLHRRVAAWRTRVPKQPDPANERAQPNPEEVDLPLSTAPDRAS